MASNTLTDALCKAAKPKEKDYKLSDGAGLYLFVTTKGGKIWRVAYRIDGKEKTKVLGPFELVSLKEARQQRDALRLQLLNGIDPQFKKQESLTFEAAVTEYWDVKKRAIRDEKTVDNALAGLRKHLVPYLGNKPLNAITMPMLLDVLMKMDKSGLSVYVRKCRGWAGQVFEWGKQFGHCTINPAKDIDPEIAFSKKPVVGFAAVTLEQVPELLVRLDKERLQSSVMASRMLALTWVRTTELRFMEWSQIEGDMWRVPKDQMKGKTGKKREHLVPLSRQALETLQTLKNMCRGSKYVFPAEFRTDRTITENCITDLFERIGYKGRMTGHGWRKVGSTWANSQASEDTRKTYAKEYVEMQLAHTPPGVEGVYNSAEYYPQRKLMLQAYADWLDQAYASGMERRELPA